MTRRAFELGIRINSVIRDWLREQIAATAD